MNRHQRRISAKNPANISVSQSSPPAASGTLPPPGRVLRLAASVLLSSWVLGRVRSPEIFSMLRQVALQAGRQDAVVRIDERLSRKP
jgi:hypothetical protein